MGSCKENTEDLYTSHPVFSNGYILFSYNQFQNQKLTLVQQLCIVVCLFIMCSFMSQPLQLRYGIRVTEHKYITHASLYSHSSPSHHP